MLLVVGILLALGTLSAEGQARPIDADVPSQATLVQKRAVRITSGTIASATFQHPNAAGNLIVVSVVWDSGGTVGLTDSAGNSYTSAIGPNRDTALSARR